MGRGAKETAEVEELATGLGDGCQEVVVPRVATGTGLPRGASCNFTDPAPAPPTGSLASCSTPMPIRTSTAGNPGGLTLCVRRCLPTLPTPPGGTGMGARIPGTERDGRCPHPAPSPLRWWAPHDEAALSGKREGSGFRPGGGPGEPFEMEVERGRPRGREEGAVGGARGGGVPCMPSLLSA